MKIQIDKIPEDGLKFDRMIRSEEMDLSGLDGKLSPEIHFKGLIRRSGRDFMLDGEYDGSWHLQCARCLKDFEFPVSDSVILHLRTVNPLEDAESKETREDELDDLDLIDHVIDLTELLREQMILQIPIKPVCSADCKGLCPVCGQDNNIKECRCEKQSIDPRLKILDKLLEK